jgi:hypothetical protein
MSAKSFGEMTSQERHEAVEQALDEVARRLASGELDGSGRYYTDEQLAALAAADRQPVKPRKASAA